jgi:proteasome lid subunit RPN8/RPN11
MTLDRIVIPDPVFIAMLEHVRACLPEEACGLLGGMGGRAVVALPVENALHSATRFRMAPEAQVAAMLELERRGLELTAIWHSHPSGPPEPSAIDTAEAAYPEAGYLIWTQTPAWTCRAFDLSGAEPCPISIVREE